MWQFNSFLPIHAAISRPPRPGPASRLTQAWDAASACMYRACPTWADTYRDARWWDGLYPRGVWTGKHKSNRDGVSCKHFSVTVQVSRQRQGNTGFCVCVHSCVCSPIELWLQETNSFVENYTCLNHFMTVTQRLMIWLRSITFYPGSRTCIMRKVMPNLFWPLQ